MDSKFTSLEIATIRRDTRARGFEHVLCPRDGIRLLWSDLEGSPLGGNGVLGLRHNTTDVLSASVKCPRCHTRAEINFRQRGPDRRQTPPGGPEPPPNADGG